MRTVIGIVGVATTMCGHIVEVTINNPEGCEVNDTTFTINPSLPTVLSQ